MAGRIRTEKQGAVGRIIFDHESRRNAISVAMWRGIPGAVRQMQEDGAIRVVIMRGAGEEAFVAGADISEFEQTRTGDNIADYDLDSARAFGALANLEKPLIAMIHGFCIGGGVAIALTADLRYAADDGRFGVPAAKLGLGYHMAGIESLVQLVGYASAKEIFFTARQFDAAEAHHMRLVDAVVPKADLEQKVMATAEQIARNAPLTIRSAKIAMRELAKQPAHRDLGAVDASIRACFESEDYREGVTAFLEKRPPRFEGK